MTAWTTFSGSDIPAISELTALFETLAVPIDTAITAAGVVREVMVLLEALILVEVPDPLGIARAAIDALVRSLTDSSIDALLIKPTFKTQENYRGLSGFLKVLKDSLSDLGDVNRPEFEAGDTSGGVVLLVSAPSYEELSVVVESMTAIFGAGWKELTDYVSLLPGQIPPFTVIEAAGTVESLVPNGDARTTFIDTEQSYKAGTSGLYDPFLGNLMTAASGRNIGTSARIASYNGGTGVYVLESPGFRFPMKVGDLYQVSTVTRAGPPDWLQARLVDIMPPIAQATELLASARDAIPFVSPKEALLAFIDSLDRKVVLFQQLATRIAAVLQQLLDIAAISGIGFVAVPPQDQGNDGFLRELYDATNPPAVDDQDFTAGIVFYGGAAEYAALEGLFPT